MRLVAFMALLLLAGCGQSASSEAEHAEKRLALLQRQGADKDELCAAKRDVQAAWLKAIDDDRYRRAKVDADLTCNDAAIDRLNH